MISYAGRNRRTVNALKTMYFDGPEWTPCGVYFLPSAWMRHREALEEVVLAHPRIFPGHRKGSVDFDFKAGLWSPLYELGRHTDCWGVVWENCARGFDSQAVGHPLAEWAAFDAWKRRLPDPLKDDLFGPRQPWDEMRRGFEQARARGDLAGGGGLPHGFFYMMLTYLRGFENCMLDLAGDDPRLHELIAIIVRHNVTVIAKYLELGAETMGFGEDLGMQTALPMSPAMWRRVIKPAYECMFGPCRDRGVPVFLHSDGHLLEIIPDLIEVGVTTLNPQFRANGLDGLRAVAKGRVAIHLDLDRQLFPFATPGQLEDHVGEAFEALYDPRGGLSLGAECGPDVAPEKVDAICTALERVCRPPALA
ncbi:MAG: Uroporphyrinogen decarboxylase (URO-D) [Lentisphaerae bacterium ADurb.BinA184]|nr:MAG: Uroporphyrinogen decarboxylase (URO-D) [Lentisphaerae bacterium ADurb.BinA184]